MPITRLINTLAGSGLAGGAALSADVNLVQDIDDLVTELVVDPFADTVGFFDDGAVGSRKAPIFTFLNSISPGVRKLAFTDRLAQRRLSDP